MATAVTGSLPATQLSVLEVRDDTTQGLNQFMPVQHPQFLPFLPTLSKTTSSFTYLLPQLVDSSLYVSKVHIFYIPNDRNHKTLGGSRVHNQQTQGSDKQRAATGQEPGLSPQQVVGTATSHPASLPGNLAQHPQRARRVNQTSSLYRNPSHSQDCSYPKSTSIKAGETNQTSALQQRQITQHVHLHPTLSLDRKISLKQQYDLQNGGTVQ